MGGAAATVASLAMFSTAFADQVEEGKYLTAAAGCLSCHTAEGSKDTYAGGHALKTPFGTFYTPNITPDKETGIGNWTEEEFIQAVKHGIAPDGSYYFPAFPYTSYRQMLDEDAKRIFAYLKSLEPVKKNVQKHDIDAPFSWRWLQFGWRLLYFNNQEFIENNLHSTSASRGDYLTNALGHCGECHTPRNALGGTKADMAFAGQKKSDGVPQVPNITPDAETGIGDWSKGDLISFLQTGMKPDFDDVQGSMGDVIAHGTSKLTDADRAAMADYLLQLTPIYNKTSN